jgi:tetratricopeptide (TPR) repeat protein
MRKNSRRLLVSCMLPLSIPLVVCLFTALVYADDLNKDYFAVYDEHDTQLLINVERYHLATGNFWKWYNAKKYYLAVEELQFVLRYFPNHPKALQLMGNIAKLTEAPALAIPYYENALRLYPEYAITHAQYGGYLVDVGNVQAAMPHLKKAIDMDPSLAQAYAALAKAYNKSGNPELAREAAAKATELGYKE